MPKTIKTALWILLFLPLGAIAQKSRPLAEPLCEPFKSIEPQPLSAFFRNEKMRPLNEPIALPAWFCAEKQPFFCRIEHRLETKSGSPVRFRLGSVEWVDHLEGKSSARWLSLQ